MAEHGGYRKPANPAPVSGPGAQSRRTDGGPAQSLSAVPDQPYGDASQQINDQRIAPMAGKPQAPSLPNVPATSDGSDNAMQMPPYPGGAFDAPSARPGEPVTTGVPIGPGAGPVNQISPANSQVTGQLTQMLQSMAATDMTGVLAPLFQAASQYGV